jgi:copper transport protein
MKRSSTWLAVVIGCAAMVLPATNVLAHAVLDNSVPASGATVAESPPQIVFDFDEPVETSLGHIKLYDSGGEQIDLPELRQDNADKSIVRVDVPTLESDTYVAAFRVISVDGHPVDGAITFKVGEGVPDDVSGVVADALSGEETDATVDAAMQLVRFVGYLGVAVLLAAIFIGLGTGALVRRWVILGGGVLAVTSAALICLQGAVAGGNSLGGVLRWDAIRGVLDTRVGEALLARTLLAGALVVAVVLVRTTTFATNQATRLLSVVAFIAIPATYAFGGHSGAAPSLVVSVLTSMFHVAAVATWFGGLVLLVCDAQLRSEETVGWFSKRAALMVPVAVAAGVVQVLVLTDEIDGLTDLSYGKWLVAKLVLVGAMLLSAAVVRKRFMSSGVTALRSVLAAEMCIGLLVLAATSGLVAEPPRDTTGGAPFSTSLVQGDIIANITLSPARVGTTEMHVIISPPGGSLAPVADATARLSLASRDVPPVPVSLALVGSNHYVGTIQIPYSGEWKLDVIVSVDASNEVLFTTKVIIR